MHLKTIKALLCLIQIHGGLYGGDGVVGLVVAQRRQNFDGQIIFDELEGTAVVNGVAEHDLIEGQQKRFSTEGTKRFGL